MSSKVRAVGYIRAASRTERGQDKSFKRQKSQILEAAKRSNIIIDGWFMQSEYVPRRYKYRALDKCLEYCESKTEIKYLVVASPSRLAREIEEFQYWKKAFERIGVRLASVDLNSLSPIYCFSNEIVVVSSWLNEKNNVEKLKQFFSPMKDKEE